MTRDVQSEYGPEFGVPLTTDHIAEETGRRKGQAKAHGGFDAAQSIAQGAATLILLPDMQQSARREGAGASPLPNSLPPKRHISARLAEITALARAISLNVVQADIIPVRQTRANSLFGTGQIARFAEDITEKQIELVIVDHALSPIQQRNLEKKLRVKVIDRTGLILEIFGARAATREGALQIELAHLNYQASRLVKSWTHLERQRGGVGFMGGPGETQIETDRRILRARITRLRKILDEVRRTRTLHRHKRQKAPFPLVALVGYTNAGKSTLFNQLTKASVMAADLLFATLDPRMRAIEGLGDEKIILSDTVGFISELPTQLVAAFRATLEELPAADLILHVRDISHPDSDVQAADVFQVLEEVGVHHGEKPILEVWNKMDLLNADRRRAISEMAAVRDDVVCVSAWEDETLAHLRTAIQTYLHQSDVTGHLSLAVTDGAPLAWLHAHGVILDQQLVDDRLQLHVRLAPEAWARFHVRWKGALQPDA